MSHELRTPLNAILLYSQLIHEDAAEQGREELASDTRRIRNSGQHLLTLINGILDLSKIEAGKMDVDLAPVDLRVLLQDAEMTLRPLADQNRDRLVVDCGEGLAPILRDELKLRQMLINLGRNAIKFTRGGAVTLRAGLEAGGLRLEVRDTGVGMTPEQADRLFRAYEQPTRETEGYAKVGGTGLGLTISKRLVDLLGASSGWRRRRASERPLSSICRCRRPAKSRVISKLRPPPRAR